MIAYIKGVVAEVGAEYAVIDNGGIGYRIFMPGSMLDYLRKGDEIKIHTHYHVREDAVLLYGFLTQKDLTLYRMLIGVNGIGPKAALGILSVLSAEDLQFAVLSEDVAAISKAPGVGKKTAQKLILELKDKMNLEEAFEDKLTKKEVNMVTHSNDLALQEAVQALVALGYSNTEALRSVKQVENADSMDTEQILKAALKKLL